MNRRQFIIGAAASLAALPLLGVEDKVKLGVDLSKDESRSMKYLLVKSDMKAWEPIKRQSVAYANHRLILSRSEPVTDHFFIHYPEMRVIKKVYEYQEQQLNGEFMAAYIKYEDKKVTSSEELTPDLIFDYAADGHVVGIEILDEELARELRKFHKPFIEFHNFYLDTQIGA